MFFCIVLPASEGVTSSPVLIDVLSFKLLNRSSKVKPVVSLKENSIKSRFYKEAQVFHTTNGTLIFDQLLPDHGLQVSFPCWLCPNSSLVDKFEFPKRNFSYFSQHVVFCLLTNFFQSIGGDDFSSFSWSVFYFSISSVHFKFSGRGGGWLVIHVCIVFKSSS